MGFGNGMAIGWPNASYQQNNIPNATAYIPYSNELNIPNTDYTIEWWTNLTWIGDQSIRVFFSFGEGTSIHSAYMIETISTGIYDFYYEVNGQGIVLNKDIEIPDNTWTFITISRNINTGIIYLAVNGVLRAENSSATFEVNVAGQPMYLGSNGTQYNINGDINNFRLSWALTEGNPPSQVPTENFGALTETKILIFQGREIHDLETNQAASPIGNVINSTGIFALNEPFATPAYGSMRFA